MQSKGIHPGLGDFRFAVKMRSLSHRISRKSSNQSDKGRHMKTLETKKAPAPIGPYSQAVVTGKTLFISGQVPIDPETGTMVSGDISVETHQVMKNLLAVLAEAGLDFSNVVKSSIFITNMDDFKVVNEVYGSYLNQPFPARETVEVRRLPANARVEISMIAELE